MGSQTQRDLTVLTWHLQARFYHEAGKFHGQTLVQGEPVRASPHQIHFIRHRDSGYDSRGLVYGLRLL
jgi:hypothetical protein